MLKERKYELVDELAQRLEEAATLIVADYRGLSVEQFDELRTELYKHGAKFRVVKNTLTLRAAEKAGVEELNEFFTGPTAIAFITDGDMVATAKALVATAKETEVLSLKGGLLEGRKIDADAIGELAKLPPFEVLQSLVVGVIAAPLTHLVSLVGAPLRDVVGVLDARIRQLEEQGDAPAAAATDDSGSEPSDVAADAAAEAEATGTENAGSESEQAVAAEGDVPASEGAQDGSTEGAGSSEQDNVDTDDSKEDDNNGDN